MSTLTRSAIFDRKREAQRNELQEDYVEMVAQLIQEKGEARIADLAESFGVTAAAVTGAITRLKKDGLVRAAPYRSVFLTESGEELAHKCAARHDLVVDFLIRLGVSRDNAEKDAEGLEHYLSDESLSCLQRFIDREKANSKNDKKEHLRGATKEPLR